MQPILDVQRLRMYFFTEEGVVKAVDDVSIKVNEGDLLGVVGESGSGKSCFALSVMKLIPRPGKILSGRVVFDGIDLTALGEEDMRKLRGSKLCMSFQDPKTFLNPIMRIGEQISEVLILHKGMTKQKARDEAIKTMELVGIPSAADRFMDYPHQLSGGMRQRCLIAMAICCDPKFLIADEPTTALDVITQHQILELLKDLKKRLKCTIMLITHDLGIVAEICEKVVVMYAGKFVEYADVRTVLRNPSHPYTMGLTKSMPRADEDIVKLEAISGWIPDMINPPSGCRFHPRCAYAQKICFEREPELRSVRSEEHLAACHILPFEKT